MLDFNFDSWAALAADNPEEFEKRRKAALLAQVASAPAHLRPKLEALVSQLCAEEPGTALEKAVRAQNLMMEQLLALQQASVGLVVAAGLSAPTPNSPVAEFTRLSVVPNEPRA